MNAQLLIRDARFAGVRIALVNGELQGEYPPDALEWFEQINANAIAVAFALAAERVCSQCGTRSGDAGTDANGDRWCVVCRDMDYQLLEGEIPALLAGRDLRSAWVGALSELGELLGHPELRFKPGHAVALGPIGWSQFAKRASIEDLRMVLARLRVLVAELPTPSTEKDDGGGVAPRGRH